MGVRRILRWSVGLAVLAVGSLAAYAWLGMPSRAEVRALRDTDPSETSLMRQRQREALACTGADADALE